MRLNAYSGDGRLRLHQAAAYLLLNALDNARPNAGADAGLEDARFACPPLLDELRRMAGTPSPSRAFCDLFWAHLPWAVLEERLGPIRMLDLGCGSGRYAEKFQTWSGRRLAQYTGVDLQTRAEWAAIANANPFATFQSADIEQIDRVLPPDVNLIVSQSTLEHVRNDALVFEKIHAHAHASGRPLLQLHAVPSAACLRLYLWHGYRQYTRRTISTLTAPFADCSTRRLIALGGDACNALHWDYITWPLMIRRAGDRRDAEPERYRAALGDAIATDIARRSAHPAFYVLLIDSNGRDPLPASPCWNDGRDSTGATT
jgi:SAM-dependent methyltransferase